MLFLYFSLYCLLTTTLCQSKNTKDLDNYFKLPRTVFPKKYYLKVKTTLEENNFVHSGTVSIYIRCRKATNKITLHSRNLVIQEVTLTEARTKNPVKVTDYRLEAKYEFLHVQLGATLTTGNIYILFVRFTGHINPELTGYYRSYYKNEFGNKVWLAATQFEPTNARAAFPCFDEPEMRATFKISLIHKDHLTGISNMPLKSTRRLDNLGRGWVIDTFEKSVSMPTYLVAYVVTDFEHETTYKNNSYGKTLLKMYARKNSMAQVKFAKDFAPKALSFFEEYFEIPYPLPKEDFVALPDFEANAMENWGLITFRETALLYDPKLSSIGDKHRIADVITHEIAHMWFGNLVTMKWWDDLWLKEGFATYLANMGVAHLFPSWEHHDILTHIQEMDNVYNVDALQKTRPISVSIKDPKLIGESFDAIAYSKGSCIIRMMEHFLGADVLRKGLTHYLNKFQYSSALKDDLWNSMSTVAHKNNTLSKGLTVKKMMDTWTTQAGHPLVTVVRDYNKSRVSVTQQRYLENTNTDDDSCYWVPLSYTTEEKKDFKNTKPKKWLSCPKKKVTFTLKNSDSWIIFNIQHSGFYKTNYDTKNWNMIIKQLKKDHKQIALLNRVVLIADVMELAMTGHVNFKIAFDLINYIHNDEEYVTWKMAFEKLNKLSVLLCRHSNYGLLQDYINSLVKPFYTQLIDTEATKRQSVIIENACDIGNKECQSEAVQMFFDWMKKPNNNPIPMYRRSLVYCIALKNGKETEWNFLWKQYLSSILGTERSMILKALGCTRDTWLQTRYLKWIIDKDSEIRNQDAHIVFSSVAINPNGFYIARSFFYDHIKDIYNIQSPKGRQMKKYIGPLVRYIQTDREIEEFNTFVRANEKYLNNAQFIIKQSFERLEIRKEWYKTHYHEVGQVLEQMNKY